MRILVPIAFLIAITAAVTGNWFVVGTMVFVIAGQVLGAVELHRRRRYGSPRR
jgi:hypothetical protein